VSIVTDFKSIRRKLERMEQKAEFEEKNPEPEPSMYGWPYGVAVPYAEKHEAAYRKALADYRAGIQHPWDVTYIKI
jgi:hypothetical protein